MSNDDDHGPLKNESQINLADLFGIVTAFCIIFTMFAAPSWFTHTLGFCAIGWLATKYTPNRSARDIQLPQDKE